MDLASTPAVDPKIEVGVKFAAWQQNGLRKFEILTFTEAAKRLGFAKLDLGPHANRLVAWPEDGNASAGAFRPDGSFWAWVGMTAPLFELATPTIVGPGRPGRIAPCSPSIVIGVRIVAGNPQLDVAVTG